LTAPPPAFAAALTIEEPSLRLVDRDGRTALRAVIGQPVIPARARLRFGPGRTCEPLARLLDRAVVQAEQAGLDPGLLIVADGSVQAGEDIVRMRRSHGVADWIASPTCLVRITLRPAGLHATVGPPPEPPAPEAPAPGALAPRAPVSGMTVAVAPVSEPPSSPAPPPAAPPVASAGGATPVTADPAAADPATAVREAADPAAAVREAADPVTLVREAADPVTAVREAAVREALSEVIDPDLGVNIVDLGFVRAVTVAGQTVAITMTLTSAACPLTSVMESQIQAGLAMVRGIDGFRVDWQWVPAWRPADITDAGREQLRAIGFTI
jgi:metal-sulfur cluster biosynthetic enzyme